MMTNELLNNSVLTINFLKQTVKGFLFLDYAHVGVLTWAPVRLMSHGLCLQPAQREKEEFFFLDFKKFFERRKCSDIFM